MRWWIWMILVIVALPVVDRLLLAAEERGWIYYRKRSPSPGTVSAALFQLHAIFQPEKQHIVEKQREIKEDQDEDGDKKPPGVSI